MKTRFFIPLLALLALVPARADEARRAYKKTWRGAATLVTLGKRDKTRDALAVYPRFTRSTPLSRVAQQTLRSVTVDSYTAFNQQLDKDLRAAKGDSSAVGTLPYGFELTPSLVLQRPRLVSVITMTYSFTGGAHGNYGTTGYNFGFPVGSSRPRQLRLADFFTDGSAARRRVGALLMNKLRATKGKDQEAMWTLDGTVKSVTNDQLENFVAQRDGLKWFFPPYAVGPYAAGEFEVRLSPRELGPTFRAGMLR